MFNELKFNCPHCGQSINFSQINDFKFIAHLSEIKTTITNEFQNDAKKEFTEKYNNILNKKLVEEKEKYEKKWKMKKNNFF